MLLLKSEAEKVKIFDIYTQVLFQSVEKGNFVRICMLFFNFTLLFFFLLIIARLVVLPDVSKEIYNNHFSILLYFSPPRNSFFSITQHYC